MPKKKATAASFWDRDVKRVESHARKALRLCPIPEVSAEQIASESLLAMSAKYEKWAASRTDAERMRLLGPAIDRVLASHAPSPSGDPARVAMDTLRGLLAALPVLWVELLRWKFYLHIKDLMLTEMIQATVSDGQEDAFKPNTIGMQVRRAHLAFIELVGSETRLSAVVVQAAFVRLFPRRVSCNSRRRSERETFLNKLTAAGAKTEFPLHDERASGRRGVAEMLESFEKLQFKRIPKVPAGRRTAQRLRRAALLAPRGMVQELTDPTGEDIAIDPLLMGAAERYILIDLICIDGGRRRWRSARAVNVGLLGYTQLRLHEAIENLDKQHMEQLNVVVGAVRAWLLAQGISIALTPGAQARTELGGR